MHPPGTLRPNSKLCRNTSSNLLRERAETKKAFHLCRYTSTNFVLCETLRNDLERQHPQSFTKRLYPNIAFI
jgi:hypothetical protein